MTFSSPVPQGERGGSVVECRTPEREVRGSKPTAAVLCPWARHFTPRKYWLITQEAMAPSRHDWKIVDWDVKPKHNQPTTCPAKSMHRETFGLSVHAFCGTGDENIIPTCREASNYYVLWEDKMKLKMPQITFLIYIHGDVCTWTSRVFGIKQETRVYNLRAKKKKSSSFLYLGKKNVCFSSEKTRYGGSA